MKTASSILFEYGIDIMKMNDDFNSQLLFAMERYAEQFKTTPSSTLDGTHAMIKMACDTSSTVDLERDYWQQRCLAAEDMIKQSTLVQNDAQHGASYTPEYYAAREKLHKLQMHHIPVKTTSQKGLVELIEWIDVQVTESSDVELFQTEILTKATELLNKK